MKSIATFFNEFLRDEVNLNKTRVKVVKEGIKTIKNYLKQSDVFQYNIIKIAPQGSHRQGTIIKPVDNRDFDVDLLLLLINITDWQPQDYLNHLHQEFKNSSIYKELVDRRGKSRCVTIDYANDFHIDIVPAIIKEGGYKVMNKNRNEFEETDGDGYARWFEEKSLITSNKFLTKAVKLFKYLRDTKGTFSIKSILLTTLLGNQVYASDINFRYLYYKDLSTTLKTLFNRLDKYLQLRPFLNDEITTNPVLPTEKFNRHWNQEKYFNFRRKVNYYNQWINEAYEENNVNEAVKKWRKVFGDDFGQIQEEAVNISFSRRDSLLYYQEEFIEDKYAIALHNKWKLVIAVVPISIEGFRKLHYRKGVNLEFYIDKNKSFLPEDIAIKWKVKNSGKEAHLYHDIRGIIEDGRYGSRTKCEVAKYKGEHYVECYALKNDVVIATDIIYVTVV